MKNKWIRLVTVMAATLIIMLAGRGISLIFSPEPVIGDVIHYDGTWHKSPVPSVLCKDSRRET